MPPELFTPWSRDTKMPYFIQTRADNLCAANVPKATLNCICVIIICVAAVHSKHDAVNNINNNNVDFVLCTYPYIINYEYMYRSGFFFRGFVIKRKKNDQKSGVLIRFGILYTRKTITTHVIHINSCRHSLLKFTSVLYIMDRIMTIIFRVCDTCIGCK